MGKVFIHMRMALMKDITNMDRNMEKVVFNMVMDPVMKVNTKIIKDKDLGSISGLMAVGILDNGKMTKWMELVCMNGLMAENT